MQDVLLLSIGLDRSRTEALDGVELCLGGAERVVTEENKMQYLAAGLEVRGGSCQEAKLHYR